MTGSPPNPSSENEQKANIISAVKTPLGFFVLVVLIVEAIMGIAAAFSTGSAQTYLIVGMITLIFFLIIVVAGIAVFRPLALYGLPEVTKEKSPDAVYEELLESLPLRARQHLEFLEECHSREIDALKRRNKKRSKALKQQIKKLKKENEELVGWIEYIRYGTPPEEL